jgi:1,4-dihydroxy-2-naphthoyl-CoA synthase
MNDTRTTTPREIRPGADWELVDGGYGDIRYETSDGIAKITICRPSARRHSSSCRTRSNGPATTRASA